MRAGRKLTRAAAEVSEGEAWTLNAQLAAEVFRSGDAIEGATAFAEKRPPVWNS